MGLKIERDQSRFKQIVRGKIRQNLRKYVSQGEMIGRKGRDLVSIPVPQLDVPHFKFGKNGSGGAGQGEGEVGQPLGRPGDDGEGGQGQAGSDPGAHILEVEVSLEELAAILGDELELPRIQPKAAKTSSRRKPATTASAAPARSRCGISNAPTCSRCGGRFRRAPTTRITRW